MMCDYGEDVELYAEEEAELHRDGIEEIQADSNSQGSSGCCMPPGTGGWTLLHRTHPMPLLLHLESLIRRLLDKWFEVKQAQYGL